MPKPILVIVESPGKIKKINSILGKDYLVKASVGHVRDLESSELSIDVDNGFAPTYVISKDKKKVVSDLKSTVKLCSEVILAADEDREGEAIAASLADVLKLKDPKRIVFNEITKTALMNALKNPRKIDYNLVRAQETRRFLDRIVGYKLSPVLWSNIAMKLSAGRVQSVVVKVIIDKETEIGNLNQESYFKINGKFHSVVNNKLSAVLYELDKNKTTDKSIKGTLLKLKEVNDVEKLLKVLDKSKYSVKLIEDKTSKRNPSPPFITSSLQQEASKKFCFNIKSTMSIAQKLYENGHITYMRTDSTSLSEEALKASEDYIVKNYGKKYHNKKNYVSKSKNAQEAHEAIRPTYIEKPTVDGTPEEKKLYSLIWKRTVASQMAAAEISINNIYIDVVHKKKIPYYFLATNETITFEGFLKVYNIKSEEDEDELQSSNTNFKKDDKLDYDEIESKEEYPKSIGRYNEASLVKKLEDLGIGRPSTYANIITKIQERKYVDKVDLEGEEKEISIASMIPEDGIKWSKSKTVLGKEKQKLIPTSIGKVVTEFLCEHFDNIMDYKFTAKLEDNLDKIVDGKEKWDSVLQKFWNEFNPKVTNLITDTSSNKLNSGKLLGSHPVTKLEIYTAVARYGPVVKMVDGKETKYAPIKKPQTVDNITLEQAVELFEYPKNLGKYNNKDVLLQKGQYGFYVKYNNKNCACTIDKDDITLTDVINIIEAKSKDIIKEVDIKGKNYQIRTGEFGHYISYKVGKKMKFTSISEDQDFKNITDDEILKMVTAKSKAGPALVNVKKIKSKVI
jgi:DNA topoisomerase I